MYTGRTHQLHEFEHVKAAAGVYLNQVTTLHMQLMLPIRSLQTLTDSRDKETILTYALDFYDQTRRSEII
jgi:hypothetical protein